MPGYVYFGTMTVKVTKGKYRSLEELVVHLAPNIGIGSRLAHQNDFWLVTTNAEMFNPHGSVYYSEANWFETWKLDHIARASAHVIEYEIDWNIDVEQADDGSTS